MVFFKYSHIIYGWKAYGKMITDVVKMLNYLHFSAQYGPNWPKSVETKKKKETEKEKNKKNNKKKEEKKKRR